MHYNKVPVWPMMFISVACGAISGFHATQSPLMARCLKSERDGKKVFYGAMCMESVIALIWAGAASAFFYDPVTNGWLAEKIVVLNGKEEVIKFIGNSTSVYNMSIYLLGLVGGAFAVIGVILCPITSGDTAFRAARLTISDWFKIDQKSTVKRFCLTAIILVIGYVISLCDYNSIWRYFSWSNQTLATIVLWVGGVFLCKNKGRNTSWVAIIPATYMTSVIVAYILQAPEGFNLNAFVSDVIGIICATSSLLIFIIKVFFAKCDKKKNLTLKMSPIKTVNGEVKNKILKNKVAINIKTKISEKTKKNKIISTKLATKIIKKNKANKTVANVSIKNKDGKMKNKTKNK